MTKTKSLCSHLNIDLNNFLSKLLFKKCFISELKVKLAFSRNFGPIHYLL